MPSEEELARRRRHTLYLIAGGTVSLLLPLGGVLYLKMTDTTAPPASVRADDIFAHREGAAVRLQPAAGAAAPQPLAMPAAPPAVSSVPATSPPQESGLSMIRGGEDYFPGKSASPAPAPQPPPAPAAAAAPAPPRAIPAPRPAAAPKTLAMPQLKPAQGFGQVRSWFSGSGQPAGAAQPQAPVGAAPPDVNALIQQAVGSAQSTQR